MILTQPATIKNKECRLRHSPPGLGCVSNIFLSAAVRSRGALLLTRTISKKFPSKKKPYTLFKICTAAKNNASSYAIHLSYCDSWEYKNNQTLLPLEPPRSCWSRMLVSNEYTILPSSLTLFSDRLISLSNNSQYGTPIGSQR